MQNTKTHDTKTQETASGKSGYRHECAPVYGGAESDFPSFKRRESVNT